MHNEKQNNEQPPRWFLGLFAVIGAGLLFFSWQACKETEHFLQRAQKTTGEVVDFFGNKKGTLFPIVRFTTLEGQALTFRGEIGESPPAYSRGDQVEVLYDPANPDTAQIHSFLQLWFKALVSFILGTAFLGSSMILYFKWQNVKSRSWRDFNS